MIRCAILSLAVLSAMNAQAAFDVKDWSWHCGVAAPQTPSEFCSVKLSPEVFDQALLSLNDLRLLDASGNLVPFIVRQERTEEQDRVEWRDVSVINRIFLPEQHACATLDFGKSIMKNELRVTLSDSETRGSNPLSSTTSYRRRVTVEGSADGQDWKVIAEDQWLFDVSLPGQEFKVDTIRLPRNDFRYLRLTVYNMSDDPRRISVQSVRAALHETVPAPGPIAVPAVTLAGPTPDEKKTYLAYEIDVGFRNLPITRIALDVPDPHFYRGYELLGRNAVTEKVERTTETGQTPVEREVPWRKVCSGVLYRVIEKDKTSELLAIEHLNAPYRYFQLRIFDADNPPLTLKGVSVERRETSLAFERGNESNWTLIGGNPKASAPSFDLSRSLPNLPESEFPSAQLGSLAHYERAPELPPWTERHRWLIWVALVVAAGMMVFLILINLRKPAVNAK